MDREPRQDADVLYCRCTVFSFQIGKVALQFRDKMIQVFQPFRFEVDALEYDSSSYK